MIHSRACGAESFLSSICLSWRTVFLLRPCRWWRRQSAFILTHQRYVFFLRVFARASTAQLLLPKCLSFWLPMALLWPLFFGFLPSIALSEVVREDFFCRCLVPFSCTFCLFIHGVYVCVCDQLWMMQAQLDMTIGNVERAREHYSLAVSQTFPLVSHTMGCPLRKRSSVSG